MTGGATRIAGESAVLADEELLALLTDLAEAPDAASASSLLLEQFTQAAGTTRGVLLVLDRSNLRLEVAATQGLAATEDGALAVGVERRDHPLIVSMASLDVVAMSERAVSALGLPFSCAVAIPFPRLVRGAGTSAPLPEPGAEIAERDRPWERLVTRRRERRRAGEYRGWAVMVLDGRPEDAVVERLASAACLIGSALERAGTVDHLRRSLVQVDSQRNLLTAIMNVLPDPIIITDAANNILVSNRRAESLLSAGEDISEGRRRAVEINNLLFSSFLSKAVLTGGAMAPARELNLVDPDEGVDLLFEVLGQPLPPSVTRERTYLSVLRDVTDLKRASAELERQFQRGRVSEIEATRERDRLNLILNNVGDPILVTDDQAKIILMNPLAEQLFELSGEADDSKRVQRVRSNDTKFTTLISDFAISPIPFRRERIALSQPETGVEIPMEVVAGKVMNERGEPLAIVCVLHDLTKQVENERLYAELKNFSAELEDRIRLATADLEAQNLRLQWQSNELEKAYRLKSEFLANMSHELRTPINALIGYTALMLDRIYGELTPKQVDGLTRIQASSQHLLALINDILDLAKIEAGKMPVHLEPTPLRPVITEVVAQLELLVKRKGLELVCEIADDVPVLHTDRTKLKQIILNLLSNAVKFTHKGSVSLIAEMADTALRITVRDTGIGIHPEHLDVIFEEFRQVDQSRTREYGGTGLGLSITRKLISLLGGDITVESEYGAGTTFTIVFPVRGEAVTVDEQVMRTMLGGSGGSS